MDQVAVMSVQYFHYTLDYYLNSMHRCGVKNLDLWGASQHSLSLIHIFGDALMAASGIKYSGFESFNKLTDFIKPGKTYHHNKENHETYKKYQNIYDSLYPATVNLMHCLSD